MAEFENNVWDLMTQMIDGWLVQCGTQTLIDGDKVRDMLLDLRSMCVANTLPEIVTLADIAEFQVPDVSASE